jgi:manganese/zinc/iron transport system permease protein
VDFFLDPLWKVALGSAVLGVVSGALGTYAVLRRQSLLGDAISHAALPGITVAFLLTRSKAPIVLVLGAAFAGWLATLLVMGIVRGSRVKYDSALGLVTFVFFGLGLVLLTYIQKNVSDARQAGLDKFLFGQAATLLMEEVYLMAGLGGATLLLVALFWKEFKLLSFDPEFGACLGFPMRLLDVLMTGLVAVGIVIGLEAVGVVLMSALLVAPAAAARQWTDRLGVMLLLSAFFGALAGVTGAVVSSQPEWLRWLDLVLGSVVEALGGRRAVFATGQTSGVPTGPAIVLCAGVVVMMSLLLAPNRGLIWDAARRWRNRRRLALDTVLLDLHVLARQHPEADHGHTVAVLQTMSPASTGVTATLRELEVRGWAYQVAPGRWALTAAGRTEAEQRFGAQSGAQEE